MKALLLLLALFAQPTPVQVAGVQKIPAYQLATLKASNATAPLSWTVYQVSKVSRYEAGGDLVFTAPPGTYLVVLKAANGSTTWEIQFTPPNGPAPIPNPGPDTPPTPQPIPKPPAPGVQPQPDPDSGFVYPPSPGGPPLAMAVANAVRRSPGYSPDEPSAMASLYSFIAKKIALDGQRPKPGLQTLTQATELVRSEEKALLQGTQLRNLKTAFPEVAKVASQEFAKQMDGQGDALTPKARASYVDFLNLLAQGFASVPPRAPQ